ncbi:MAG: TetR/AcrR family transcriptional regulator [bacterium]|nr:TetR/AcrR family transcriptional regulator [bacterium]
MLFGLVCATATPEAGLAADGGSQAVGSGGRGNSVLFRACFCPGGMDMPDGDDPRGRRDVGETTRRLLEAAAAEFVEHGYEKAVVSDIARRAGVTTGAVYARWPHKSDVMVAALDRIFEEILPEQRIKDFGSDALPVGDIFVMWGALLLSSDATQDVLVQVFGSARNNPAVQERLQRFLGDQADQLAHLVDRGKDEGIFDPELGTASVTLMIQAIGIGTHLLLSAGRDDLHLPSEREWAELIARLLGGLKPQGQ